MRNIHYQIVDRIEYAEWLRVRNPKKRRNTTIIEGYDMSIPNCVPIVFSIDKWKIEPDEYDRISDWISNALDVPNQTVTFAQDDPNQGLRYGMLSIAHAKIERPNGTICITNGVKEYSELLKNNLNSTFVTIFSNNLELNDGDLDCIQSIKSDWSMEPTRDQVEFMIDRFGAFASSIESHNPVEFPAYVLWCKSDLVEKITSHDDHSITLFEEEWPIMQCTSGLHDWGMLD